jgi:hypothetical protein
MDNKIIKLEDKIATLILLDNQRSVHFEYENNLMVSAYTYNSTTRETFLLKKEVGLSYIDCLEKILEYVKSSQTSYNSYTVIWNRKGRSERNVSYFSCRDILEVVDKFFEGKDKNLYLVYEIKMNTIS